MSGSREANESSYCDWDEDVHGDLYSKEAMEEYPDGYDWICCGRNETEPGCKTTEHKAGERSRKMGIRS